jgi:methylated-DNA-protein-cysteine methyltransferase-like protein
MTSNDPLQTTAATLMAQVFALVRACPTGRVTTYGWLAKAVGYPRGARMIGWIMNEATGDVPAQRVVNSKGELSGSWAFATPGVMRDTLASEGITFLEDGRVDLKRYGWDPSRDLDDAQRATMLAGATGAPTQPGERLLHLLHHDVASPFRQGGGG